MHQIHVLKYRRVFVINGRKSFEIVVNSEGVVIVYSNNTDQAQ